MSVKTPKWKEVRPAERLNRILAKPTLPSRFSPGRYRSESVDVLFNNSRSRLYSSMEMNILNHTREEDQISKKDNPSDKKEELDHKLSALRLPTLHLGERQSTQLHESAQHSILKSSQIISEIKKEYQAFKNNIMAQLQRQKNMVQAMIKEIVLTMQFQLQKTARGGQVKIGLQKQKDQNKKGFQQQAKDGIGKDISNTKSINQWKQQLATISITNAPPKNHIRIENSPGNQLTSNQGKEGKKDLQPPKSLLSFDVFLGSLDNLRKQMNQMDKILDAPESGNYKPIAIQSKSH